MSDNLQTIIKKNTLHCIRIGKPFQYMMNLSTIGYQNHGVRSKDSLNYGVNHSLDWYNWYKKGDHDLKTEFYALKQGANAVLNYVMDNMVENETE